MAARFAVYLSKKWAEVDGEYDDQREWEHFAQLREGAAIPEDVEYQPKYAIAADLIKDARDAGIEHTCVIADANYGMRSTFRKLLRELDEPYILEVETGRPYFVPEELEIVEPGPTPGRGWARKYRTIPDGIDVKSGGEIADELYDVVWTEVTGIKEQQVNSAVRSTVVEFVWCRMRINVESKAKPAGYCSNVIMGRSGGGELKVWLCWGLDDATLEELVKWAHLRWAIEQFHNHIKQLPGAE